MRVSDHETKDTETGQHLAYVITASRESVNYVLAQDVDDEDGRSNWVWLRLPNGDLLLGVFPQGDTYFAVEVDADLRGRV